MSDVTKLVPHFLLQSQVFQALYNVENQELNAIENAIDDILNQCFIDTATWGLDLWDKFLGINTKEYATQERRNILKAKTMSQPPFTKQALLNLLKNFTYDAEIQERYDEYTFDVFLKVKEQLGNKLHYILSWINETKPAHLDYQVIIDCLMQLQIKCSFSKYYSSELKNVEHLM